MSLILILTGVGLFSLGEVISSRKSQRHSSVAAVLVPSTELTGVVAIIAGAIVLFVQVVG